MFKISVLDKKISLKIAVSLVLISFITIIVLGVAVGNIFFWDKYENLTKEQFDLQRAQANLKQNPKSPQAHVDLGWVYVEQKKYNQAIKEYERAIGLDKDFLPAHYNLALVKIQLNQYAEARKILEKIKGKDPNYLTNRATLGFVYTEMGEFDKALAEYDFVKVRLPANSDLYYQYGRLYEKMGEMDKAEQSYKEALKYTPDFRKAKEALEKLQGR